MRTYGSILLAVLFCVQCGKSQSELINRSLNLPELLDSLEVRIENMHIHINKGDFILSLMSDTIIIKQYPVVLGGNPVDDKLRQGDQCTPEGRFRVRAKYPHPSWSKFIWIDYPNEASWEKHRRAKAEGLIPEQAGIGGEIGIHGVPRGTDRLIDLGMNWTLGCISLKNKDINELYPCIRRGSLVIIEK